MKWIASLLLAVLGGCEFQSCDYTRSLSACETNSLRNVLEACDIDDLTSSDMNSRGRLGIPGTFMTGSSLRVLEASGWGDGIFEGLINELKRSKGRDDGFWEELEDYFEDRWEDGEFAGAYFMSVVAASFAAVTLCVLFIFMMMICCRSCCGGGGGGKNVVKGPSRKSVLVVVILFMLLTVFGVWCVVWPFGRSRNHFNGLQCSTFHSVNEVLYAPTASNEFVGLNQVNNYLDIIRRSDPTLALSSDLVKNLLAQVALGYIAPTIGTYELIKDTKYRWDNTTFQLGGIEMISSDHSDPLVSARAIRDELVGKIAGYATDKTTNIDTSILSSTGALGQDAIKSLLRALERSEGSVTRGFNDINPYVTPIWFGVLILSLCLLILIFPVMGLLFKTSRNGERRNAGSGKGSRLAIWMVWIFGIVSFFCWVLSAGMLALARTADDACIVSKTTFLNDGRFDLLMEDDRAANVAKTCFSSKGDGDVMTALGSDESDRLELMDHVKNSLNALFSGSSASYTIDRPAYKSSGEPRKILLKNDLSTAIVPAHIVYDRDDFEKDGTTYYGYNSVQRSLDAFLRQHLISADCPHVVIRPNQTWRGDIVVTVDLLVANVEDRSRVFFKGLAGQSFQNDCLSRNTDRARVVYEALVPVALAYAGLEELERDFSVTDIGTKEFFDPCPIGSKCPIFISQDRHGDTINTSLASYEKWRSSTFQSDASQLTLRELVTLMPNYSDFARVLHPLMEPRFTNCGVLGGHIRRLRAIGCQGVVGDAALLGWGYMVLGVATLAASIYFFVFYRKSRHQQGEGTDSPTDVEMQQPLSSAMNPSEFFLACSHGDIATTIRACEIFAPNSLVDNVRSNTPVHLAAYYGWPDVVRVLCQHGWSPRELNDNKLSPMVACLCNRETPERIKQDVIQTLVEFGATLDRLPGEVDTALCCVVRQCDFSMIRFLVRNGATTDAAGFDDAMEMARSYIDQRLMDALTRP